uniref:Dynamin-related protein 3A n=1 Tax=Vitis vinifera TaxID=29760 RepID=F6H3K1_VITVI
MLMLQNRPPRGDSDDAREWGEFRHLPGKRFYDFSKIRQEIQDETERGAGFNKGVSEKQIRLMISSPNVLNMTLIDLPGITKVPVGDQPTDIEARVKKMIMSHIKQENCIILAVTPANSDLANSDALQMARDADPAGTRTIGVITKLDIMDRGTNACNFLLGNIVPLSLGYVGVVNRSQEDLNQNRSISEALAYEDQFFHDHPVYHGLSDCCGVPQLAKKLNQILEHHIRMVLPSLKDELNCHMIAVVKELQTSGEVVESKVEQGAVLLSILKKYCEAFSALVDGKSQEMSTRELSGGARIHYIFQSIFVKSLEEVDPCEALTDEDIRMAIQNANGPRNALFVPEVPFQILVRRQIHRLLDPSLQCLRYVHAELLKMSHACEAPEVQRFPVLRRKLEDVMGKFLRDGIKPAERMIGNMIEMEKGYINSSHPNFIGGSKAVELAVQQLRSSQVYSTIYSQTVACNFTGNAYSRTWGISSIIGKWASPNDRSANTALGETFHDMELLPSMIQLRDPPPILKPLETQTEREAVEVIVTKLLLRSYYDIVRKNVQDFVPKAIMHFLVNHTKRDLLNAFVQKLYRENLFKEMLREQDDVILKRKRSQEMFCVLQQAIQAIDEVDSEMSSPNSNSSFSADTTMRLPRTPSHHSHV